MSKKNKGYYIISERYGDVINASNPRNALHKFFKDIDVVSADDQDKYCVFCIEDAAKFKVTLEAKFTKKN